jgi:hypothetical protein
MKTLEKVLAHFSAKQDRGELAPVEGTRNGTTMDVAPEVHTAVTLLAQADNPLLLPMDPSPAEIDEAHRHGCTLLQEGELTPEQVQATVIDIMQTVEELGESAANN